MLRVLQAFRETYLSSSIELKVNTMDFALVSHNCNFVLTANIFTSNDLKTLDSSGSGEGLVPVSDGTRE